MTLATIGERIAYLRKKAGLSQSSLMKQLAFENLGKYETNERLPRIDLVIALARFFGISTDWILLGEEPSPQTEDAEETPAAASQEMNALSDEDCYLLSLYHRLTERDRGKAEGYMEGLLSTQKYSPPSVQTILQEEENEDSATNRPGLNYCI